MSTHRLKNQSGTLSEEGSALKNIRLKFILYPAADKSHLSKITGICADNVVNIGIDQFCNKNVTRRGQMSVIEIISELFVDDWSILAEVDDVAIIEKLRKGGQGFANQTR